jgi:acetyltransferase-like isoleucine patch superfamily enzyme
MNPMDLLPDGVRVYLRWWRTRMRNPGCMIAQSAQVSPDSRLEQPCRVYEGARLWSSQVGRCSYVGIDAILSSATVGRFVSIAPRVLIGGGMHPTREWVSSSPWFYSDAPWTGSVPASARKRFEDLPATHIGSDVWLGYAAIVLPGVTIGNGAIVGAGSVVIDDVPPYAIVVGTPARILRYRFSPEVCAKLLERAWWNLPLGELERDYESFNDHRKYLDRAADRSAT